jgi:hypothetical protein
MRKYDFRKTHGFTFIYRIDRINMFGNFYTNMFFIKNPVSGPIEESHGEEYLKTETYSMNKRVDI